MKYIQKSQEPEKFANWKALKNDDVDKQAGAKITIEKLALNINKLQNMRKVAIDAVLLGIEDLTNAEIQQLAQGYEQLDFNGQHTPFCAAIIYLLKNYF